MKFTIYEDDDVSFKAERVGTATLLLHCKVSHWSPAKYKKMLKVFGQFLNESLGYLGYREVITVTPNPKFCKLFGGKTVNSFTYEGKYYEVVRWD